MQRSSIIYSVALGMFLALAGMAEAESSALSQQLGVGAHYWTTLKNLDAQAVDKDGFSYLLMYQVHYGWIGAEAGVEWFPKGFGGADQAVYQPQAHLILGKVIYVAAGIGGYITDGKLSDQPFYALRAGLDIPLLPILHLDLNCNYRFEDWSDLSSEGKKIASDTLTLGAAARLVF